LIERYRDLVIIYENETAFVVSCDSLGAIGNKEHDVLKVDEEIVGRTTLKVALSELLSVGAVPLVISDTLSVEMYPTGEKILKGIKRELEENGLNVILTGSTEENFPTSMTGIGITAVGRAKKEDLKIRKVKKGMHIALIGYPRVGNEVLGAKDIMTLKDYIKISKAKEVVEAVPVGSKGIAYEVGVLEEIYGFRIKKDSEIKVDLFKSAGPSTCCLVVCEEKDLDLVKNITDKPFTHIGIIE
jgi:thiamine monophosphate kinase